MSSTTPSIIAKRSRGRPRKQPLQEPMPEPMPESMIQPPSVPINTNTNTNAEIESDEAFARALQEEDYAQSQSDSRITSDSLLAQQLSAWGEGGSSGAIADDDDMDAILEQIAQLERQTQFPQRQQRPPNTTSTIDSTIDDETDFAPFAGLMAREKEREQEIRKRIEQEVAQQDRIALLRQQDWEYEQSLLADQQKEIAHLHSNPESHIEEPASAISSTVENLPDAKSEDADDEAPLSPASMRRARLAHFANMRS